MNEADKTISVREAYLAMFQYFDALYWRTKSDALGGLLGSMSLLSDGSTADPAVWNDWLRCVQKARDGQVDALLRFIPLADGPREELMVIAGVIEAAGRLIVLDPDFGIPMDGWQSRSVGATIVKPDGERFDWPLTLQLSHINSRTIDPAFLWRIVPIFRNLGKDALPIGSRVFVPSETVRQLKGAAA